jgi:thiamine biosynthesis protein ThiI
VVVDLREEAEWEDWHFPGSVHHPSWQLVDAQRVLDRGHTYVLYCDRGIQSAQIAESMQRKGYEAYAFRGGTAALRRMTEGG